MVFEDFLDCQRVLAVLGKRVARLRRYAYDLTRKDGATGIDGL